MKYNDNPERITEYVKKHLSMIENFYTLQCYTNDFYNHEYPNTTEEEIEFASSCMDAEWGDCGCSKAVFSLSDDDDFVIKIPFQGLLREPYGEDEPDFFEFENAVNEIVDEEIDSYLLDYWDYCSLESRIYELAVEKELDCFFTETRFLCYYEGHPIYVAKKASNEFSHKIADTMDDLTVSTAKKIRSDGNFWALDEAVVVMFIHQYGKEKTEKLLDFIKTVGIWDFHSGNIKYDENGFIKIIDYSDYNE